MAKLSFEARVKRVERSYAAKQMQTCIRETAKVFQKLVRIANSDDQGFCECITCGKRLKWNHAGLDAGHFISRRHNATIFEVDNCHPQCVKCNRYESGNMIAYREKLDDRIGTDRVEQLIARSKETRSFTRHELARLKIEMLDEIRIHEARLAGE